MQTFFWVMAVALLSMPVLLCLFTAFLLLTHRVEDDDIIEFGSWLDEDDKNA